MESKIASPDRVEFRSDALQPRTEAQSSGVSWGAVIGGAFVAAAVYLILLALGAGFGLSAISPWSNEGVSSSTAGGMAIAWLVFIEIVAAALGGYLTGRLRTKWTLIHSDEVFFRDTANGFLSWAVALVVSVTLLASAAATMAGGLRTATVANGNTTVSTTGPAAYYVDTLFRSGHAGATGDAGLQAETERIFNHALRENRMPPADHDYLAQLVSVKTGIGLPEADKRVSDVFGEARQAEDTARRITSHLLLWLFLSLLMGAFCASYAATIGGRQRDHVRAV